MPDIPTREPSRFTAGDTVKFTITLADYPADDGWTLKYSFTGAELQEITATADGAAHAIVISAADSLKFKPGTYWYKAYASKAAERYTVREGSVEVLQNTEGLGEAYDGRSHVKRTLDALDALIEGKASRDQMSYAIEGRSLSRMPIQDLLHWRGIYRGLYRQELEAERRRQGKPSRNIIRGRFNRIR